MLGSFSKRDYHCLPAAHDEKLALSYFFLTLFPLLPGFLVCFFIR